MNKMKFVIAAVVAVGLVGCSNDSMITDPDPVQRDYVQHHNCQFIERVPGRTSLHDDGRVRGTRPLLVYHCEGIDDNVYIWELPK